MSRRLADSGRKPLEINGSGLQHEYRFRASTGKNQKIEFAWENDGARGGIQVKKVGLCFQMVMTHIAPD